MDGECQELDETGNEEKENSGGFLLFFFVVRGSLLPRR